MGCYFLLMNIVAICTVLSRTLVFCGAGVKIRDPWLVNFGNAILGDRPLRYIAWNEVESLSIYYRGMFCYTVKIKRIDGKSVTIKLFGRSVYNAMIQACLKCHPQIHLMLRE